MKNPCNTCKNRFRNCKECVYTPNYYPATEDEFQEALRDQKVRLQEREWSNTIRGEDK